MELRFNESIDCFMAVAIDLLGCDSVELRYPESRDFIYSNLFTSLVVIKYCSESQAHMAYRNVDSLRDLTHSPLYML